MQITIFEGSRGVGKSTLASKMRQKTSETTLINFTGFHEDGEEGLNKVSEYYDSWMKLLFSLTSHSSKLIFDRFFFSELVYSKLYKSYDFSEKNEQLANLLDDLSSMGVKIDIVFLTIEDEDELRQRLMRDKVPFGKAEENVKETLRQQDEYKKSLNAFHFIFGNENLQLHHVDTTNKTNDEVYAEVTKKLKPLN